MRSVGGVAAIAIGGVLLWAISQGYTKNFQASWNALVGAGAPNGGRLSNKGFGASGSWGGGASGSWAGLSGAPWNASPFILASQMETGGVPLPYPAVMG